MAVSYMYYKGIDLCSVRVAIVTNDARQTVRDTALRFDIGNVSTNKTLKKCFNLKYFELVVLKKSKCFPCGSLADQR